MCFVDIYSLRYSIVSYSRTYGSSTHSTIEGHCEQILSTWIGSRPVIVQCHGFDYTCIQSGDGVYVQLSEVVMSSVPFGWFHLNVTVSHDSAFASTLVGTHNPTESVYHVL